MNELKSTKGLDLSKDSQEMTTGGRARTLQCLGLETHRSPRESWERG